jgi:hypothetical protein
VVRALVGNFSGAKTQKQKEIYRDDVLVDFDPQRFTLALT